MVFFILFILGAQVGGGGAKIKKNYLKKSKIVSEYDQEIPQSQTADNRVAPRGRAAQPSQSNKVAKIRNRYNQVPHLTQDTNGKVTNSQKTPQTRAKRSALSQQVTTKHI